MILTIFFIGYIASYFFLKICMSQQGQYTWTKEDRIIALILSTGSFLTIVLLITIFLVVEYSKDLTKPVKW